MPGLQRASGGRVWKARGIRAAIDLSLGKLSAASDLFRGYVHQIPLLGFVAATLMFVADVSERKPLSRIARPLAPTLFSIKPTGYRSPLTIRRADTDRAVVRQVLAIEEYRPMANLANVKLIVDCGANIGVSAYYFLPRYPDARVIAIEPDGDNFALCRRNLAAFGDRVTLLRAAVWSECCPLRIAPASRTLGAWARRVEPALPDASDVEGVTIPEILKRAHVEPPIDLLKVDIEDAETEVFRNHLRGWTRPVTSRSNCTALRRRAPFSRHSPITSTRVMSRGS